MLSIALQQNYPLSAINYYRFMWPIACLGMDKEEDGTEKLNVFYQFIDKIYNYDQRLMETLAADLLLIHSTTAMYGYGGGPRVLEIQDAEPWLLRFKDGEYNIRLTPAVCIDTDDDFLSTDVTNFFYKEIGSRGPEGNELVDWSQVKAKTPDGEVVLWGPTAETEERREWTPSKGRYRQLKQRELHRKAVGVTYSTPLLKEKMDAWTGREGFWFPNCVWRKIYDDYVQAPQAEDPVILWTGGSSHYHDVGEIAKPLAELIKKYPKSKMIVFGQRYKWFHDMFPPEQFKFIEWLPCEAYWPRMHTLGHNINLCPVTNQEFNLSKSAIKWYESSAPGVPAATIAANVGPYKEIQDGETGFLYSSPEEFYQKLEILMTEPGRRKQLAEGAHRWVWKNRNLEDWAPKLKDYWLECVHRHVEAVKEKHALVAEF